MTRAELEQIAREAAAQYNLPVDVFLRLIDQESRFKVDALSPKGAYGPAQLMPDTAAELGVNREDPRENIFGGAKYLSQLLNQFGEMPLALAAYNAGMGNVKKYGGVPPFKETQNYLKAILGSTDGQPLNAMRNNAMVGNMQTPPIFPPQQQQQQGGLRGLLQGFMQPSEATGLTGPENFAAALDALILPQARMGEQIRARGAQRLMQQRKNATAEMLRRMPDGAPYANMIDQGMPAQEVYAQYMKDRREGVIGSSLSKDAFTNVRDINKDLASDFDVKVFQQAQQGFEALKYAFDNPSGVSDYALTIAFAKILDPASVVREGEQAAIAKSGGAIDSFLRQTENFFKGDGSLPEEVRRDIFNLAANNYTKYMERAQGRYSEAEQLLIARGIDPKFLRKLDFTDVANVQAQKPSEQTLGIPPVPEGSTINGQPMTMAQWISIWNSKTEEDRSYFLENGVFPS